MNRRNAKTEAENNTRTWGELLGMIEQSDLTGMSKLNKVLTRERVAQIMRNMIAERDPGESPKPTDRLGVQNILREFA